MVGAAARYGDINLQDRNEGEGGFMHAHVLWMRVDSRNLVCDSKGVLPSPTPLAPATLLSNAPKYCRQFPLPGHRNGFYECDLASTSCSHVCMVHPMISRYIIAMKIYLRHSGSRDLVAYSRRPEIAS